eukprot:TRINITY_DN1875_c0_g1_i2.p1 TRINITY_DN1875_c0_g1~~TRINITY_DN1875_c0_g1_i2.p1  ORF type:complete len:428 (-),score=74.28 TRINITY_DN1875_c0_g1_i2:136-1419(-)
MEIFPFQLFLLSISLVLFVNGQACDNSTGQPTNTGTWSTSWTGDNWNDRTSYVTPLATGGVRSSSSPNAFLDIIYQNSITGTTQLQSSIGALNWAQRSDTGNNNGSIGVAINYDPVGQTGYLCYVNGGGVWPDCQGGQFVATQGSRFAIIKLGAGSGCSKIQTLANNAFHYTTYDWLSRTGDSRRYKMTFSRIGNSLTCSVDFSATNDGTATISATDPSPLDNTNAKMGVYALGGYFRAYSFQFSRCPNPPPPTSTSSTTSSTTSSSTTSSTSSTSSTQSSLSSLPSYASQSNATTSTLINPDLIASPSSALSSSTIIYIGVGVAFFVLIVIIVVLLFLFVRYRRRSSHQGPIPMSAIPMRGGSIASSIPIAEDPTGIIEHVEIKEELGSGNFGMVYRGIYQGTEVALKGLKASHKEEFAKEAEVIK